MNRRTLLQSLLASAAAGATQPLWAAGATEGVQLGPATAFDPSQVIEAARRLAAAPFAPRAEVPAEWRDLSYVEYRDIRFAPDRALWSGSDAPARLDLFAPGLYFPRPVQVHEVAGGQARPILFDAGLFTYGKEVPEGLPITDDLGFSGLRLRGSLTQPGFGEEFFVLQGASYFRAIAAHQTYGLSARGLALGTGEAGEEFPDFIEFWVERPAAGSATTVIHALMDSPSIAGAYRFAVTPGAATLVDVSATLIPRQTQDKAGLAPLTSMFLFDGTNRERFSDFRPAVHDSEGLAMHTGRGEHIWRPLANPRDLQVSAFIDENPRGFGLMQRHRAFGDFADLEANYHRRPSLWVTPGDDWGKGHVILVEIPADKEIYDNIVAFWRPSAPLEAGVETRLDYRLTWAMGDSLEEGAPPLPKVLETRIGRDAFGPGYLAVIDFAPDPVLPTDLADLTPLVRASAGSASDGLIQRNPETGGPRLAFKFDPEAAGLVEFRAQLRQGEAPASETWLYRWTG